MTKTQFAIWLEGYFELSNEENLTKQQMIILLNHANLVKIISKNRDEEIEKIISLIKLYLETGKTDFPSRTQLHSFLTQITKA